MLRPATFVVICATLFAIGPPSRADYAVMRSGTRLHITGYQQTGDRMRLTIPGGAVEVAASDVVAIEPEETFAPNPAAESVTGPFAELIRKAAAKHGVDGVLIQRVIAEESNFNARAISRKDARGLMQLLPKTAAQYAVADVFDPAQNIDAGTNYLKDLLEQYQGNLSLALAAYNAGPEMVERYGGIPPFPETQSYVQRITEELAKAKARKNGSTALVNAAGRAGTKQNGKAVGSNGSSSRAVGATAAAGAGTAAAGSPAAPGLD